MDLSRLDTLQEMTATGKEFADIFAYFLDHFGEDPEFRNGGAAARNPVVEAALGRMAGQILRKSIHTAEILLIEEPKTGLMHGSFQAEGLLGSFFYFDKIHMGVAAATAVNLKGTLYMRFTGIPLVKPTDPRRN